MKRAVAYRVWISDLSSGEYVAGGSIENPTFIKLGERKISRVDVIGIIAEESPNAIIVQDKTGKIAVKIFGEPLTVKKGELVRVIGKIRQDQAGRFISGEIIKRVDDANYQLLREKELGQPLVEEISF